MTGDTLGFPAPLPVGQSLAKACFTIAVIGAGFSGTLLALHLMQRSPHCTRVLLIERSSQFGRGAAYGTSNPSHLLNVPAGRMSAFQREPGHFLDWLREQPLEEVGGTPPTAASFMPRHIFGRYVRHLLNREIKRESGNILDLVRGAVREIRPHAGGLTLLLDRERQVEADIAVLAVGNFPPEAPPVVEEGGFFDGPFYRSDPWAPEALEGLDPEAPVLLVGTGLTAVDTVISLLDQGHRGPIWALSRRGLLPRRHAERAGAPPAAVSAIPPTVTALARSLRRAAKQVTAEGGQWHGVIDQLRPYTADVWQSLSFADRERFLRHLRPWWDVHRHRMAGAVADRVEAAQACGQLGRLTGRLRGFQVTHFDGRVTAVYQPRGGGTPQSLEVARVINCTGQGADYARISDPLIRSLLAQGLVRPDPLRLGLDVTAGCALRDAGGAISRRLFAVGPVTRGTFWEMTAVPDIRQQCEALAGHLASQVITAPAPDFARVRGQRAIFDI
jgi:uncharacterized NAD(P)/FAD-binding protein YdhS